MKLSIIIPIYNSEKIIPTLINSINENLKDFLNTYEIILVNDFSKDKSWDTIVELSNNYNFIKGINLEQNYGQHYAIFIGLKFAKGEKIVCMDDDMQHDPFYIKKIIKKLNEGNEICYVRYLGRKHNAVKIFISWLNNLVSSYLMSKSAKVYTSSYKGFINDIKNKIIKNSSDFVFLDYWIFQYGKKIDVIDVYHKKRYQGDSNYKLRQLITLWSNMIFLIDVKKKNIKTLVVIFFKFVFKTFFKNYINYKENRKIQIRSKTF
tara:strand:+ start:603 stop:1391 length:789 start_codon:yes stop_codon:yes gene_type:complete